MPEVLCTECGAVGAPKDKACSACGGTLLLPADAPAARAFIERRAARAGTAPQPEASARASATGKVLGRSLGKLFGK